MGGQENCRRNCVPSTIPWFKLCFFGSATLLSVEFFTPQDMTANKFKKMSGKQYERHTTQHNIREMSDCIIKLVTSVFISGCPNQEIG
jgi:hypothetical protein